MVNRKTTFVSFICIDGKQKDDLRIIYLADSKQKDDLNPKNFLKKFKKNEKNGDSKQKDDLKTENLENK